MQHILIVDIVDDSDRDLPNGREYQFDAVAHEIQRTLESAYPCATIHVYAGGPHARLKADMESLNKETASR